jgi:hypothetical protein
LDALDEGIRHKGLLKEVAGRNVRGRVRGKARDVQHFDSGVLGVDLPAKRDAIHSGHHDIRYEQLDSAGEPLEEFVCT